jgi:mannose-6-phosphate isomerase-like protein (cupin superfamily)
MIQMPHYGEQPFVGSEGSKMTLVNLAEKADLSLSFISQVERGLTNPSINSLRKIALALGTPLSSFFEEGLSNDGPVMRKKQRKILINTDSRLTYQLLSSSLDHRVELLLTRLEVAAASSKNPMAHKGDEAAFVLQGACRVEIKNEAYDLEEGDSIYIKENTPHKTTNTGSIPLVIISAISPPGF